MSGFEKTNSKDDVQVLKAKKGRYENTYHKKISMVPDRKKGQSI